MLPVPFAFSRMGVLLGIVTMAVVAYSNSLTSVLLLRAAGLTGHDSYEGVAYAIGGKGWKVHLLSERRASSAWPLDILCWVHSMQQAAYHHHHHSAQGCGLATSACCRW